jgi:hypothetical protein
VPALLTPREFVIQQKITKKFGATVFADINEGRLDPRIGYEDGQRPQIRTVPVKGHRYATGGLVGRAAALVTPGTNIESMPVNITVPGGGPPDPVALGVQLVRTVEYRAGGSPRQD